MKEAAIVEEDAPDKDIEEEETKEGPRTSRRSVTEKMRSWLMKKQEKENELPALIKLRCQDSKYDDSASASSDDLETIEDE